MCDIAERYRKISVVAVQTGHDVAIDAGEAEIDRVGLPAIPFTPPADAIAAIFQELDGAVLRGAILHVIMQVRIVLIQHAIDRGVEIARVIEARRYDGDARDLRRHRRRRRKRDPAQRTGRMLLERPHRRAQPKASKKQPRPPTPVSFDQRDAILYFAQSFQKIVLKFVFPSSSPPPPPSSLKPPSPSHLFSH